MIVKGLQGVAQIKDDVVIHGTGAEHDTRLRLFLARIQEHGLTLRKEKCKFGVTEVLVWPCVRQARHERGPCGGHTGQQGGPRHHGGRVGRETVGGAREPP